MPQTDEPEIKEQIYKSEKILHLNKSAVVNFTYSPFIEFELQKLGYLPKIDDEYDGAKSPNQCLLSKSIKSPKSWKRRKTFDNKPIFNVLISD